MSGDFFRTINHKLDDLKRCLQLVNTYQHQYIRFFFTGLVNTVFGYIVFSLFLFGGASYSFSLLIATILGIVFNYFSFGYIVYNKTISWLGFIKIIISYVITYSLNVVGLFILNNYFFVNLYIGQIIYTPLNVLLSSLLINFWVYKN
jgi:putative flippase GtrA